MQESDVNFARIQDRNPSTSARMSTLGFQFASHDKRVSHEWSKTTYTEEAAAGHKDNYSIRKGYDKKVDKARGTRTVREVITSG